MEWDGMGWDGMEWDRMGWMGWRAEGPTARGTETHAIARGTHGTRTSCLVMRGQGQSRNLLPGHKDPKRGADKIST